MASAHRAGDGGGLRPAFAVAPEYGRWFLLGEKRKELLALWEVQQYGRDSFGDSDYVSLYGLKPADWYARGVRILGRTAVECEQCLKSVDRAWEERTLPGDRIKAPS
jgi:hypothetical protein